MQEDAIKQEEEKQRWQGGREKTGDTEWNQEQGSKLFAYMYVCEDINKCTHICVYVCRPVWMLCYCPCMFTPIHRHTCMHACLHLRVYASIDKQLPDNLRPLLDVVRLPVPHQGSLTPLLPEGSTRQTISQENPGSRKLSLGRMLNPLSIMILLNRLILDWIKKKVYIYTLDALICPLQRINIMFSKFCPLTGSLSFYLSCQE